jgi:type I restriction enzyme S subunit
MQLLQHFKELTIRPKNAKELKGLILQLAIQGKLTANWRKENPNIVSASELLNRIQKERTTLIKEKKVRKGKVIQPINDDEKYLEIPQNWVWTRLIEAGNIFNGNSVNKSVKAAKYEGLEDGLPYIGTKDVNYGFEALNYDNGVKIPFDEPKFKIAHKNTALICSEGGSAGKKCGITTEDVCFGNKLYALEQYGNIEAIYILSTYKTPVFFEAFQSKMTGIIGGVSINSFGEIPIPLPPLEEQKEIVKTVEILFKEVEQLEQLTVKRIGLKEDFVTSVLNQLTTSNANQEWTFLQNHFKSFFNEPTNIKKLRETVLQLAVQGKLTADWRSRHPELVEGSHHASQLLKRIQEEKAQLIADKKIKKEKALPSITKEEIPYELPDGWVWCRMGDIIRFMAYGTSQKTNNDDKTVPVLRMGNISSEGKLHFNNLKYIPIEHKDLPKLYLNFGDLVFNRTNSYELVGKSAVYIGEEHKYTLASYLIKVSLFIDEIDFDYINNYIISNTCRKTQIEPQITAQTNQANFSGSKLRNVLVPLPSKKEQKAIVEKVNALMSLCDALEQEVQQSQAYSEHLMQSVLKEVFEKE